MARCCALLKAPHGGRWRCLREAQGPSGLCTACFLKREAQKATAAAERSLAEAAGLTAPALGPYLRDCDPGDERDR